MLKKVRVIVLLGVMCMAGMAAAEWEEGFAACKADKKR